MNQGLIHNISKTDSTNNYVKSLLEHEYPPELSMYVAEEQTKGRGQRGSFWFSECGKNHTATIVLYPSFLSPVNQFQLSKFISLAVLETLSRYVNPDKLSVKWPNDIYYNQQKIGGILLESSLMGNIFEYVVAGIGINVNQDTFPSWLPNPVSLKLITSGEINLFEFNEQFHQTITRLYEPSYILSNTIHQLYLSRLYLFNQYSTYLSKGNRFKARITNVDPYGHLVLKKEDNTELSFAFKEVEYC